MVIEGNELTNERVRPGEGADQTKGSTRRMGRPGEGADQTKGSTKRSQSDEGGRRDEGERKAPVARSFPENQAE